MTKNANRIWSAPKLSPWKAKAAGIVAGLVQLGALFSLVLIYDVGGHDAFYRATYGLYTVLGLPVDGSVVIALGLAVHGAALRRRKRAALNLLLAFQYLEMGFLFSTLAWRLTHGRHFRPAIQHAVSPMAALWLLGILTLAALCVLVVLHMLRPAFCARTAPGSFWRAGTHLVAGLVTVSAMGWLLTEFFHHGLDTVGERLGWAANQVFGRVFTLRGFGVHGEGPAWLSVLLGALAAAVAAYALIEFFVSARERRVFTESEELQIRQLLAEHGESDSLGYFATRRDKSVVFAPNGEAAVTYRVLGGTTLASGDPVGDPDAWSAAVQEWLAEAAHYGWVPAALGASERGARCYRAAGLKALELGDEAIVDVRVFSLSGRERRSVRQAAQRLRRLGYRTVIRRHGEIPARQLHDFAVKADAWRGENTERGFSMALSRLGDLSDARCVMVEAYDAEGQLRGLLSFVPWGRAGLSLDLMRRDRAAANGLNEYMVAELVEAAGQLGAHRISLNFAMFRAVFEAGEKIGAGPVLRAWRAVLSFFSRYFQLESLYRANAKYGPDWVPRFLCFQRARQLPRVSLAAGMVEGFVPYWRRIYESRNGVRSEAFYAAAREIDERAAVAGPPPGRLPEQVRARRDKIELLRAAGMEPYPAEFPRGSTLAEVSTRFGCLRPDFHTGEQARVAGRVVAKRAMGGLCFLVLRDFSGELQVMLDAAVLGGKELRTCVHAVDLGDQLGIYGEIVTSRRGELSVLAESWTLTAKCLHPLPDKRKGLVDEETRVRRRYLDLVVNPEARQMLELRSRVTAAVRGFLSELDYVEIETPMLQNVHGGANARPFVTHINAYDQRVYLRIAPELYLKRLCVAGVDRVFELNRNFRNEGADATHNPEFTMLEAYQAYADYRTMLGLARRLVQHAARAAYGAEVVRRGGEELDISGDWPVVPVHEAVSSALRTEVTPETPLPRLRAACERADVTVRGEWSHGRQVMAAYEELVEPSAERPVFYTDFPIEVSPLTRRHRHDSRLAERWDLVAFGAEIGTAYSELTDPVEQRERLRAQSVQAAGGDTEAMELDEDFLLALEHGMPPTGGLGLGLDRLLMMLTGATIRQTVPFPFVRAGRR
ncbi:MAG: bifunctional lysylphosphatidylglycerol synthetase/lysine--tRNA ligase LysX [Sciscionella sp.]